MSTSSGLKAHWGFRSLVMTGDAAHTLAVNTGNGNLLVTATDYAFPARIPAVVSHAYNHLDAQAAPGMLGRGWRLGFEERIVDQGEGGARYTDPAGTEYSWTLQNGEYVPPAGVFSKLELDEQAGEFLLTAPSGFRRAFDSAAGYLKRYEDNNGNVLRFVRSGEDQHLVSVEVSCPEGWQPLIDTFAYDETSGRLIGLGLSTVEGLQWGFEYDTTWQRLTGVTDPLGQKWAYGYDQQGRLDLVADPRACVVQPPSYALTIAYNGTNRVQSLTDPLEGTITFGYDPGFATTVTDRRGSQNRILHGPGTLEVRSIALPLSPPNNIVRFTWSQALLLTQVEDALGRTTQYEYDGAGNLTQITDACSPANVTVMTYEGGDLTSVTTPLGNVTEFEYDERRNLLRVHRPLGQTTELTYSESGDLLSLTDPVGQRTEYTYGQVFGEPLTASQVIQEGGETRLLTTRYTYGPASLMLSEALNPSGIVTRYDCDVLGRVEHVRDYFDSEHFVERSFEYDECGNLVRQEDQLGNATTFQYDYVNRVWRTKRPLSAGDFSTECTYDEEGNLVASSQATGGEDLLTTTFEYDAMGRMTGITLPAVGGDPAPPLSQYSMDYDAAGNLTARTDPESGSITYTFDPLNRVIGEQGPVADLEFAYAYDADGRLTSLVGQPNGPEGYTPRAYSYTYDDNGRLTTVVDPLQQRIEYVYFDNDQLQSMRLPRQSANEGPSSRTYTYDSAGKLSGVTDARGCTESRRYRDDGLLLETRDVEGGLTECSYDGIGRLSRIDYGLGAYASYEYDDAGRLTHLHGPDAFHTSYSYDDRGCLLSLTRHDESVEPATTCTTAYSYDELDRVLSILDPRNRLDTFAYDAHGRLIEKHEDVNHELPEEVTDGLDYCHQYKYDLKGRLTHITFPDAGQRKSSYDEADRVTAIEDAEGRQTRFVYDLWGCLLERWFPDSTVERYTYDELGRLVQQSNHTGDAYSLGYDENGNNIALEAPFGAETDFYYNERDELVAVIDTPGGEGTPPRIETFAYTPAGRLQTYGGTGEELWHFEYDALGRWTKACNALGRVYTRAYHASNALARAGDPNGASFEMTYNGLRLRTSTTAAHASPPLTVDYSWEYLDLQQVTEPGGRTQTFERDRFGRITRVTESVGEDDFITEYGYDWRDQVTRRELPASAGSEEYTYDSRGLLTQIDYDQPEAQVTMSYDVRGRQVAVQFPDGMRREFVYNRLGRLVADAFTDADGYCFAAYYSYDHHGARVTEVRERRYPPTALWPAYVLQDGSGNPIITTSGPTEQQPLPNYDVYTYEAYSAEHPELTVEWRMRTAGSGPVQFTIAYVPGSPGQPVGFPVDLQDNATQPPTRTIRVLDPQGVWQWVVGGDATLAPPDWGTANPELLRSQRQLNAAGQVTAESTGLSVSPVAPAVYDWGKDCCGLNAAKSQEGDALATAKHGRAGVQREIGFAKELLASGIGALNKVEGPWEELFDPEGPDIQKMLRRNPLTPGDPRCYWSDYLEGIMLLLDCGLYSGKIERLRKLGEQVPVNLAAFDYDSFGRLTRSTDLTGEEPVQRSYHTDWLTGNTDLEIDAGTEQGTSYNHAAGYTRVAIFYLPVPDWQQWLIRGSLGQVKLAVDSEGKVTDYFGYGSFGGRIAQINYDSQQHVVPAYLDSDLAPLASMPQLKPAAGTAQDMTQMVGALDAAEESGAAGIGASVNPDTMLGGNATFLQDWARLHGVQPPELGPMRVPPELQRPGFPEVLGPSAAPPTVQDGASVADARLAGMWQPQEYYGAKPGFQLGSWQVDDLRNTRLPLPMSPPVGAVTGPPGWLGTSDLQEFIWSGDLGKLRHPYQLLGAYPPRSPRAGLGPHPMLPNPDSARTEACGTTESKSSSGGSSSDKWDSYYRNMEAAAGGSFARPDPSGSAGAGSAQSASSGGRSKEPDDAGDEKALWDAYYAAMAAAMEDAGGTAWCLDETDPDIGLGMSLAYDTGVPFAGFLYDKSNQLTRGWLNRSINSMPRWAIEALGAGVYVARVAVEFFSLGLLGGAGAGARAGTEAAEEGIALGAEAAKVPAWVRAERDLARRIRGFSQWRVLPEGYPGRESRILDQYDRLTMTGYDAKTGWRKLTPELQRQIDKDVRLLNESGRRIVKRIEWWFYRGESGGIGPAPDLAEALRAAGIRIRIIRRRL